MFFRCRPLIRFFEKSVRQLSLYIRHFKNKLRIFARRFPKRFSVVAAGGRNKQSKTKALWWGLGQSPNKKGCALTHSPKYAARFDAYSNFTFSASIHRSNFFNLLIFFVFLNTHYLSSRELEI